MLIGNLHLKSWIWKKLWKCIKLALCQTTYHFNISFSIAMRSSSGIVELRSVCPVKLLHNLNSEFDNTSEDKKTKQECIPVGCIPPAAVAVTGGEGPTHSPLEQTPWNRHPPPQSRHPLARSPSTSPLAVGLDQIPLNFPLGCGPGNLQGMLEYHPPPRRPAARHARIPPAMHAGIAPPCEQNHRCLWKYSLAPASLRGVTNCELTVGARNDHRVTSIHFCRGEI